MSLKRTSLDIINDLPDYNYYSSNKKQKGRQPRKPRIPRKTKFVYEPTDKTVNDEYSLDLGEYYEKLGFIILIVYYNLLGKLKKTTISVYNGRINVHIRQFFINKFTGEETAGMKGITLSVDQWKKMSEHVCIP